MTTSMQQIPAGYKQTEIGVIPMDWELAHLSTMVTRIGSGITPTGGERVYSKEGRPFLRSQNVGWGQLLLDDLVFLTDRIHESFPSSEIVEGDVLLNITGASIGRCAVADSRIAGGNVNQHVCEIRTNRKVLDPYYLSYYLLSSTGQDQIDSFQAGGNRQGLNYNQIRSFVIPRPSVPEQTAIASVLSDTDELIEKLVKLIEKKENIIQGVMQELLTGKRRLPGFERNKGYKQTNIGMIPLDWEVKYVGSLGTFSKGRGIKKDDLVTYGIPCIRYGEIYTKHNYYIKKYHSFITQNIASKSYRLKSGDILFAGSGETKEEIGKCIAYIGESETYAGGDIIVLSPQDTDSLFLGYLLNSPMVNKQKSSKGHGDAVVHISSKNLGEIEITLPSNRTEQNAIAIALSDMDKEIEILERILDKYRQIKTGMMRELLTGKIRIHEPTS